MNAKHSILPLGVSKPVLYQGTIVTDAFSLSSFGTSKEARYANRLLGVIQKFREYKANRQARMQETSQPWAGKFAADLPPANFAEQLSHYKTVIDGGLVKM